MSLISAENVLHKYDCFKRKNSFVIPAKQTVRECEIGQYMQYIEYYK